VVILTDQIVPIAPIPPVVALSEVTDAQLARYAELIYRRTGIRVAPQKKSLLSNRVRRRLRETRIEGFDEYYEHLQRLRDDDPEWDGFLQEITTHETYLFRDENHWEWFRGTYLPECAAEARAGKRPRSLRIWSAACSTGDEACTAACCIAACLPDVQKWQVRIVGTDIAAGALAQARAARFSERSVRLVPTGYRARFFSQDPHDGLWQARPAVTAMLSFRQHNLLEPLRERPFDVVLLKNVLIYFAPASKKRAVEHVRSLVQPGGLLVAGPAEGIGDLLTDYVRLEPWLYQRPRQ
jgi:chemotaxis protein methyltransferase CheR